MRPTLTIAALMFGCSPASDAAPPDGSQGVSDEAGPTMDGAIDARCPGCLADNAGQDAGCSGCPTPECTKMSDCAGNAGGEYCSTKNECVACLESPDCSASDPVCTGHACVGCTKKADCSARAATPACDAPSGDCVECTPVDDAKCTAASKVCKTGGTACVQCNENADCTDGTKPICGSNNVCRGCTAESDCQENGEVCREATGECVQCEPNKDDAKLENCPNGNACHPSLFTCTGAPRGMLSTCDRCVSDGECTGGTKCVMTNFGGAPHGTYCLIIAPDSPTVCPNQYAAKRTASSALGVSDDYCFPNDTFTTCEAILDFGNVCGTATACGAADIADGICQGDVCTYGCDKARDCSGSTDVVNKCIGGIQKFCDPN